MSRVRLGGGALATVLAFVAFVAGCAGSSGEPEGSSELSVVEEAPRGEDAELDGVLGNDRVGRVLRANPTRIPHDLAPFEALFGVGRSCARPDSREIFAVEEKDTRITGQQVETKEVLPRLVIGGCNETPSVAGSMRQTFELLVAMVSDASRPVDDPLPVTPVEIMALDDTTGLYNFYVLEAGPTPRSNSTVTRFVRRADDVVEKWQKVTGKAATREVTANRKCFDCHVHGGPIMNELTEPWTHWVSSHAVLSRPLAGGSRQLVSEARPFSSEHARSSLANQLEQITRAAIATWIEGLPERPGSGLGPRILSGAQPGGSPSLARSVFCETEVNYASAFDTVPMALFLDETAANVAGLEPPLAPLGVDPFPVLLPVRSETDKRFERFLMKTKLLRPDTVLAIRLVDDEQEVFSAARCGLYPTVARRLSQGISLEEASRAAVLASLPSAGPSKRHAFIRALLAEDGDPAVRARAEAAYVSELATRLADAATKLDTDAGRAELDARLAGRQAAARAMFPRAANPLPLTHPPGSSSP